MTDPDAAELRVVGSLIEKQRTTPDQYPLTLNALRLACNQSTNRDPVVDYDEGAIRDALERLGKRGWTRLATWSNRRTVKYRHLFDEALRLSDAETALLCVLMLRGAQTSGELKPRTERLHQFADTGEVETTLAALGERGLVTQLHRQPGERGRRFAHTLGDQGAESEVVPVEPVATGSDLEERVARLEAEVAELRARLTPEPEPAVPADP